MDNDIHSQIDYEDVAMLIVSWDGYQEIWKPFFHCFFKYWPDCPYPIFLGSNTQSYPDSRVSPILIGPDIDYSSNLIKMLDQIQEDWIILFVDDVFLSGIINTERVCRLINEARRRRAGCLRLNILPYSLISLSLPETEGWKIVEVATGIEYRVGMGLCLWNKNTLLNLLKPGETAWEIERQGTLRSFGMDEKFFSVPICSRYQPLFPMVHGLLKGVRTWESIAFLRREGLEDCFVERPRQAVWDYIYIKIYMLVRYHVYRSLLRLGLR